MLKIFECGSSVWFCQNNTSKVIPVRQHHSCSRVVFDYMCGMHEYIVTSVKNEDDKFDAICQESAVRYVGKPFYCLCSFAAGLTRAKKILFLSKLSSFSCFFTPHELPRQIYEVINQLIFCSHPELAFNICHWNF